MTKQELLAELLKSEAQYFRERLIKYLEILLNETYQRISSATKDELVDIQIRARVFEELLKKFRS